MKQQRTTILSPDGWFAIDTGRPRDAWLSVERALDAWYREHKQAPTLYLSAYLAPMTTWLIRQHCQALSAPVQVLFHSETADRGRLA